MWVVPGRTAVAVALGEPDERPLEVERGPTSSSSIARRVQSRRSVATWSLRDRPVWSLPGERPDPLGQRRLDVHVDVLERRVPRERARRDVLGERRQAVDERRRPRPRSGARRAPARARARWSPRGRRRRARASTSIERVKSATRASCSSLNRPPQSPHRASVVRSHATRPTGRHRHTRAVGRRARGQRSWPGSPA